MKTQQGFEYSLLVKGIYGRNRKIKFKSFPIFPEYIKRDDAKVLEYALAMLDKLNLKEGGLYAVIEQPTEFQETDGVTFKAVTLFSDRKILPWSEYRKP